MNPYGAIFHIVLISWVLPKGDTAHNHDFDLKSDIGYTAIVYIDNKPKCTATLISRMWAVTTCLCIKDVVRTRVYLRIGDPTIRARKKHMFYKTDVVEVHPNCMASDGVYHNENDIALMQLNEPFFDSRYVFIAKMPNQLTFWTPDSILALDLAAYTDLKDSAITLKDAVWHTSSYLLHPRVCQKHLRKKNYKPGKSMCASYHHEKGENDCELDIGAPIGFDYTLIGILSYKEKGCGDKDAIASFVNVPMHSQWIRQTTVKHTPWIVL